MTKFNFKEEIPDRTYHTQIPNILSQIGLKASSISLYFAIKRSSGEDGKCTKSKEKLCSEAGISGGTFSKVLHSLEQNQKIINKPLIKVQSRIHEHGDSDTHLITIIDIWPENVKFWR